MLEGALEGTKLMKPDASSIAFIKTVPEDEAEGALLRAYRRAADPKSGNVDHIMKIHSLHPASLLDHQRMYSTLMYGDSPLSRAQREMIGVVVSAINRCEY